MGGNLYWYGPTEKIWRRGNRMKARLLIVSLATCLAGCVTFGQLEDGLSALNGRPLSDAIAILGYPSGERTIAGMRLVTWSTSSSGVVMLPQTTTTTGTVYGTGGMTSYSANTNSLAPMPYSYSCTITLNVADSDLIVGEQYEGNLGGCSRYIKALNRARS